MTVIKKFLSQHPNYTFDSLIRVVASYEYVSFDIFDTLIKRAVTSPHDVFLTAAKLLVEREKLDIEPEIIAQTRIRAETQARDQKPLNCEITLDDIYEAMPCEYREISPIYKAVELETEKMVCHADPVMKKVFDWCKTQQKKIVLISDMYLDKPFLTELLEYCGYDGYEALYISSQFGCTKKTGQLYDVVSKQLSLSKNQVIHIGDSLRGDWLRAKKHHLSAKLIARDPMRCKFIRIHDLYQAQKKTWNDLRSVFNGYEDTEWSPFYQYGFEVVGPLLYGFSKWLHDTVQQNGVKKLFFLSRDGFLLQQAYNSVFVESAVENQYLYLSTKTIRQAQTWLFSDLTEVMDSFPPNTYIKLEDFCQSFGIDQNNVESIWRECGLNKNDYFLPQEFRSDFRLRKFCEKVQNIVFDESKRNYYKTIKYLRQQNFGGRVAIVDIGWRGTIQNCLKKIIDAGVDLSVSLSGYYLGLCSMANGENMFSFIPASEEPNVFVTSFFEFPFPPAEGTLIGYDEQDGVVLPVKHDCEFDDMERLNISLTQRGALYFIECANKEPVFNKLADVNVAYANLRRICQQPTLNEVKLFGNLSFYTHSRHLLAAPKPLYHYITHPRELPYDLSTCGWKNAFLKRLLKIRLDYYRLLKLYKRKLN